MQPTLEDIAKVCHEANRAYCQTVGDNSQPEWDDAEDWQRSSAVNGVQFHLDILHHNPQSAHGPLPAAASHESWMRQKAAEGWTYGEDKDPDEKTHPAFLPFNDLPPDQRAKDFIFSAIVRAFHEAFPGLTAVHARKQAVPHAEHGKVVGA